jgi:hypothetical protein
MHDSSLTARPAICSEQMLEQLKQLQPKLFKPKPMQQAQHS